MSRPEHIAPPQEFYNDNEATKYTNNTRIQNIQAEMTERCLELLNLPPEQSAFLLDIGCGSGLSGELLSDAGHHWVGVDISPSMLSVALEREVDGDLFLGDIGQGFGFRPGSFDGAISVSVLQWLCNADAKAHSPPQRLQSFFNTLFGSLSMGTKAVFQFYPESDTQVQLIMATATKAGFTGGLVIDYPNSKKARKFYLVLFCGQQPGVKNEMPAARTDDMNESTVQYDKSKKNKSRRMKGVVSGKERKEWVLKKKALYRTRGKEGVPEDSKYTARRRKPLF